MRVLILTNKIPYPPTDGGAIATLNMALGLDAAGAKVKILAMSTPKHNSKAADFPDAILNKIEVTDVFVDTSISLGNAVKNLLFKELPYNAERFISSDFRRELTLVLKEKYYVVQLEGPYLLPYIDIIKKFHKGIIALRAHNVEWEIWQRNATLQSNPLVKLYFSLISKRLKKFEKQLLDNIDALVPITKRDELKFRQMGFTGKSFVAQTGFEETSTKKDFASMEYPSIFHIGGLDWLPNREGIIWFLKKCWPQIQAQMPNLKFYIAGRNAPEKFSKYVSGQKNVIFCGEVEDSADFMFSKALMVVPLLSGSGMRVKIVEGLARKRAIVSTSIGIEGLEVINGVEVAIADNANDFSQKVVEILTNKTIFDTMVNAGKKFVDSRLDNKIITLNLLKFYKNLV